MIVPQYWAEARLQERKDNRQITVRRFDWSDKSESEAQRMADVRAQEAMKKAIAGEKIARREPEIPYNGASGVPIREVILSRHGEAIITRNSYGAHCLNTPNVLFVDVDFGSEPSSRFVFVVAMVFFVAGFALGRPLPQPLLPFATYLPEASSKSSTPRWEKTVAKIALEFPRKLL